MDSVCSYLLGTCLRKQVLHVTGVGVHVRIYLCMYVTPKHMNGF